MSIQSDAAKAHIEKLLTAEYGVVLTHKHVGTLYTLSNELTAYREFYFSIDRKWRFDYAVPPLLCAKSLSVFRPYYHLKGRTIELDGGTFQGIRSGHSSGVGLRNWREKNNAAMSAGWRVWHYAPEEAIKAGRKMAKQRADDDGRTQRDRGSDLISHENGKPCVTLPDEPVLRRLPWL